MFTERGRMHRKYKMHFFNHQANIFEPEVQKEDNNKSESTLYWIQNINP